jgi:hypothetical protein
MRHGDGSRVLGDCHRQLTFSFTSVSHGDCHRSRCQRWENRTGSLMDAALANHATETSPKCILKTPPHRDGVFCLHFFFSVKS